ncbi:pyridoxal phosphate-dependent aminotransferase [Halobacillus litoralis]|uniref:Pyridoxal phosphate-dependent aminotransferase n=1 Tax=Halobacillus litoralis TaxID=45668 RepID=A0A845DWR1_9BACI|nr:DegT/DnrJ/EryC1/StrS family aminotransferase [Halobacillus litoralis]MYL20762.1 pyridoxal phosphate-dependent aminotransferase [Halobacillus litoralis]
MNKIYLSPPHLTGEEQPYLNQAFKENWVSVVGSNIQHFERQLSGYLGVSNTVALNSGTSAIHLALKILGVGQNDVVLCQDFTFVATINPVLYEKAVPVLIDSEPETLNMCPDALKKALMECAAQGKKPKAVIAVHLYGMPAKIKQIKDVCNEFDVPLIEDAAEALGSQVHQRYAGTFGDIGIFSFNGNKIITTSSGGALVTENPEWAEKARYLAAQAKENLPYYQHKEIGHNYVMNNLSAGIGCGQMEALESRIEARRNVHARYEAGLSEIIGVTFLKEPDAYVSNRWLSTIRFDQSFSRTFPFELKESLDREGIEIRNMWKPMHLQPLCVNFKRVTTRTQMLTEELFYSGICLPSGSALTIADQERVIAAVKKKVHEYRDQSENSVHYSVG